MARSKFTAETRAAIVERTAAGLTIDDAARAVELTGTTIKNWLKRGRRETGTDYAEFALDMARAREKAQERDGSAMDHDELMTYTAMAVRRGSVAAMKLMKDLLDEQAERAARMPAASSDDDVLAEIDELAERRRAA